MLYIYKPLLLHQKHKRTPINKPKKMNWAKEIVCLPCKMVNPGSIPSTLSPIKPNNDKLILKFLCKNKGQNEFLPNSDRESLVAFTSKVPKYYLAQQGPSSTAPSRLTLNQ